MCVCVCFSDVDTPEPDEKSVLTYVSSLYDVFPQPPADHPLYDAVSSRPSSELGMVRRTITSTSTSTTADLLRTDHHSAARRTVTAAAPPPVSTARPETWTPWT